MWRLIVTVLIAVLLLVAVTGVDASELDVSVVLEADEAFVGYPICGYVQFANHGDKDAVVVGEVNLRYRGVGVVVGTPGGGEVAFPVYRPDRYSIGSTELRVSSGGALRIPLFFLRVGGEYILSEAGEYTVTYVNDNIGVSAQAVLRVKGGVPPSDYRAHFDRFDRIDHPFFFSGETVAGIERSALSLGNSVYSEALYMAIAYHDNKWAVKKCISKTLELRGDLVGQVDLRKSYKYNRDMWNLLAKDAEAQRDDGGVYYLYR